MAQRSRKKSRVLVIDASILHAAGTFASEDQGSTKCRRLLIAVYEICHRCVVNSEIRDEWRRHASRFARDWQVQMTARGKILPGPPISATAFADALRGCKLEEFQVAVAQKDFPLVHAALSADLFIFSLDDRARRAFAAASDEIRQFGRIRWVNPLHHADMLEAWLSGHAATPREWNLDPTRERG